MLSDDFLNQIGSQKDHPNRQLRLLQKLLSDEITGRLRTNQTQAKEFPDAMGRVLAQYASRQLTSAQVVEKLVELAKQIRDARHRHEQLGLTSEEAAFYDTLAGSTSDLEANPELAKIAGEIVIALRKVQRGHGARPRRTPLPTLRLVRPAADVPLARRPT